MVSIAHAHLKRPEKRPRQSCNHGHRVEYVSAGGPRRRHGAILPRGPRVREAVAGGRGGRRARRRRGSSLRGRRGRRRLRALALAVAVAVAVHRRGGLAVAAGLGPALPGALGLVAAAAAGSLARRVARRVPVCVRLGGDGPRVGHVEGVAGDDVVSEPGGLQCGVDVKAGARAGGGLEGGEAGCGHGARVDQDLGISVAERVLSWRAGLCVSHDGARVLCIGEGEALDGAVDCRQCRGCCGRRETRLHPVKEGMWVLVGWDVKIDHYHSIRRASQLGCCRNCWLSRRCCVELAMLNLK